MMKNKPSTPIKEILQGLAEQATPAHFDLWQRINRRAGRRSATRRHNVLLGLATLGTGLIITLALFFAVRARSSTTISMISSPSGDAMQAATEAPTTLADIKSYRGVIFGQARGVVTRDNPLGYQLWQAYVWYQAPDLLRIEAYSSCPRNPINIPGQVSTPTPLKQGLRAEFSGPIFSRCPTPDQITIHNDQDTLHIEKQGYTVTATYGTSVAFSPLESAIPVDVDGFLPSAQKAMSSMGHPAPYTSAEFSALSTESIIGRPAKKIDETYGFINSPGSSSGDRPIHRTLWIDEEVGIPIAAETIDGQGFIWDSWTFTLLEVNGFIDPSIFAYLPPTSDSIYINGLAEIWTRMAHNAPFAVFSPGGNTPANIHIASTLMPNYPAYDPQQHILKQTYLSRADPTKASVVLTITERPGSGTPSAGYQYQEVSGTRTLVIGRNGTHITFEGKDEVTKQDLYDIADKLQPVSDS